MLQQLYKVRQGTFVTLKMKKIHASLSAYKIQ